MKGVIIHLLREMKGGLLDCSPLSLEEFGSEWSVLPVEVDNFNVSQSDREQFGLSVIPDIVKHFNPCGAIFKFRLLWSQSNLLDKTYSRMFHRNITCHKGTKTR